MSLYSIKLALVLFLLQLSLTDLLHAQSYKRKENNIWVVGRQSALDLNGVPVAISCSYEPVFGVNGHPSSVSDKNGNLLFYTNGGYVWNANQSLMPNGFNLANTYSLNFSAPEVACNSLIVPMPGNAHKYYVFSMVYDNTLNPPNIFHGARLYYSIVDLSLDNGLGDVENSAYPVLLDSNLAYEPIVSALGDQCNAWVIVHDKDTNMFKSWEITGAGLIPAPVISHTGTFINYPQPSLGNIFWSGSNFCISPDRKKLAHSVACGWDVSVVELFDFDAGNGTISNSLIIDGYPLYGFSNGGVGTFGSVAFSPDNSKLYTSMLALTGNPVSTAYRIKQYDLSTTAMLPVDVGTVYGWDVQLRLASDDKIYFTTWTQPGILVGNTKIGRIQFPDNPGPSCQVDTVSAIGPVLPGKIMSFPHEVPVFHYDSLSSGKAVNLCFADSILLRVADSSGTDYLWSTGDTGFYQSADTPGLYIVRYFTTSTCSHHTDSFRVVREVNPVMLGEDTLMCPGDILVLGPRNTIKGNAAYQWSNGSTLAQTTVTDTGTIVLTVTEGPCSSADSMHIGLESFCECRVQVASAFSPNGDGLNDIFKPVMTQGCPVAEYMLNIYNRYGQRIYSGTNIDQGWNGLHAGQPADAGTYFYELKFKAGIKKEPFYRKGDITLIR